MRSTAFLISLVHISLATSSFLGPSSSLDVVNANIMPDGFNRSSVLVNGVFPAPLIKSNKGNSFHLNVINSLRDPTMLRGTSIHWHGIFQNRTAWADGPIGVTQCPIAPGRSFSYQFSSTSQAGTFWYHSHFGNQYCDGLRGAMVIYDPNDPHKSLYDVDDESTVITLGEWYHTPSPSISGPAIADSTLINGKGRFPGGPMVDLSIINVQAGKRYRFRLVSISCDPSYTFSIDGHKLTVIEADGESTLPVETDTIQIFAGQRYSFILHADQPVSNYWVRALPSSGNRNLSMGYTDGTNSAILRYQKAKIQDPTTQATNGTLLQETSLHPLSSPAAPGKPCIGCADVNLTLALSSDLSNPAAPRFLINGSSFQPPSVPVLLQILSGKHQAQDLLPKGSVYTLPKNKVIEVTIPGGLIGGPHPFHLHGHAFSVVTSAGNSTQPNFVNPVRRDVVSIGDAGSSVTIRFVTDNAGPWILHCHIDWHLNIGLAVVFAEDPKDTKVRVPTPESWDELCPIYDALPPSATSVSIVPLVTPS